MNSFGDWSAARMILLCLVIVSGCWSGNPVAETDDDQRSEKIVRQIVDSEELILLLNHELGSLSHSAKNLQLPDHQGRELFADQVSVTDWDLDRHVAVESKMVDRSDLNLWPQLWEQLKYFQHVKFYMIRGQFESAANDRFQSDVGFAGLARKKDGGWQALKGQVDVTWQSAGNNKWSIARWSTKKLSESDSEQLAFSDQLEQLIGDRKQIELLRTSQHMEFAKQIFETGNLKLDFPELEKGLTGGNLEQYFRIQQAGQHPGVSVVDYDNDGWDDLYICDEWRPNKMLRNVQGKQLVDVAPQIGLDLGPSTSAVFVDVDNDGDQDAFVGCIFQSCKLMINQDGKYVDRTTELISADLPNLTTSVCAADYNNDGLVDIYISTYGFPAGRQSSRSRYWIRDFLTDEEQDVMRSGQPGSHRILNAIGPPNLLLMNTGNGGFRRAPVNDDVQLHHNTFQASWCDYDLDGDPDLYVCNDFAPDFLLRNDGDQGFIDVTLEAGGEDMLGFGMGACWGDYDGDGDFDLYVSNMYSKAGKRITRQIESLDERFFRMANGNRLFANEGDKFRLVPDSTGEGSLAGKAGWSWGGQFADFNNNGRLDLYVCAGFFTAPEKYASTVDL